MRDVPCIQANIDMSMMVKIACDDHYEYGSSIIGQGFVMVKVEDPPHN